MGLVRKRGMLFLRGGRGGGVGKRGGVFVFRGGGGGGETPMYTMVMMRSCFPFLCVRYHTRPHAVASLYRLNYLSKLG